MNEKTLIIHHLHKLNENTDFFIRNALWNRYSHQSNIDYIFTVNDPTFENKDYSKLQEEYGNKLKIVRRENTGLDYGGYGYALFQSNRGVRNYDYYDYFVFTNSACRGPFLPSYWPKNKHWSEAFIDKISEEVKLVGTDINSVRGKNPFTNGFCFATDKTGVEIGINKGIFQENAPRLGRSEVVLKKEVGFSTQIINAGYNIAALTSHVGGIDFRRKGSWEKAWKRRSYLWQDMIGKTGGNVTPSSWQMTQPHTKCLEQYRHPYEVIFVHSRETCRWRKKGWDKIALKLSDSFCDWHDKKWCK